MIHKNSRLIRFFTLIVVVLMALLPTMQASAIMVHCRTDPIFTLSNGDTVTVTLDITTDPLYIKSVAYILHVPAGVTATSVLFTPGTVGKKEVYNIIQDSPAGVYTSDSFVKSKNTAEVTAAMDINSTIFQSVAGYDGQDLIVTISTGGGTRTTITTNK